MTLIVCVDDAFGMAFGGRRQSRDRAVCQDILRLAAGAVVRMDSRSTKLFEGLGGSVATTGDLWEAGKGEFCFAEFQPVETLAESAEKLILYRWNRRYPADLYFTVPLDAWRLADTAEFAGSSHETITREVYIR